jgi:hypothetical protein
VTPKSSHLPYSAGAETHLWKPFHMSLSIFPYISFSYIMTCVVYLPHFFLYYYFLSGRCYPACLSPKCRIDTSTTFLTVDVYFNMAHVLLVSPPDSSQIVPLLPCNTKNISEPYCLALCSCLGLTSLVQVLARSLWPLFFAISQM